MLGKQCSGDHSHTLLIGGWKSRDAQVYPRRLCESIIVGLQNQIISDKGAGHLSNIELDGEYRATRLPESRVHQRCADKHGLESLNFEEDEHGPDLEQPS